jgi:hypothetical protein
MAELSLHDFSSLLNRLSCRLDPVERQKLHNLCAVCDLLLRDELFLRFVRSWTAFKTSQ